MSMLDLEAFRRTPLVTKPFDYCIIPRFIKPECLIAFRPTTPTSNKVAVFQWAS